MWFWQADQEVEELIAIGQRRLWRSLHSAGVGTAAGLFDCLADVC